jgi:hypothetical protein
MPDRPVILRSTVTALQDSTGRWIARANVWTAKGYSSKTFNTVAEAKAWVPNA